MRMYKIISAVCTMYSRFYNLNIICASTIQDASTTNNQIVFYLLNLLHDCKESRFYFKFVTIYVSVHHPNSLP